MGPARRCACGLRTCGPAAATTAERIVTAWSTSPCWTPVFCKPRIPIPHVSLAVGGVSIIDGPPPDYGDLVSAFAEQGAELSRAAPRCCILTRSTSVHRNGWMTPTSTSRITSIASRCRIRAMTPSCSG